MCGQRRLRDGKCPEKRYAQRRGATRKKRAEAGLEQKMKKSEAAVGGTGGRLLEEKEEVLVGGSGKQEEVAQKPEPNRGTSVDPGKSM